MTIDIGTRRELFVDSFLVERLRKAFFHQHGPRLENVAKRHNKAWEGPFSLYDTVIQDEGRVLYYYRGWAQPGQPAVYCLAESADGIAFKRPNLGLHAWKGSKKNNIILVGGTGAENNVTHSFAPFRNTRPGAPRGQRFLALGLGKARNSHNNWGTVLHAYASADGIRWRRLRRKPVITDGAFDSQNVAFWSEAEGQYVAYYRTFSHLEGVEEDHRGPTTRARRLRRIKRAVSKDFIHWAPGEVMTYRAGSEAAPAEEFYINQTRPYFRAPHIYIALPARFMAGRSPLTEAEGKATGAPPTQLNCCSDTCFMTSRPGNTWYDRTFMEALIKPRIGDKHWTGRCNYPADGIVQTGPEEMSIYVDEFYAQKENQLRRYSLRLDGFSSIRAPLSGGECLTRPFIFAGDVLELNYATSAAGSLRVEIRDHQNRPIHGYELRNAMDLFGNRLDGQARWRAGDDVSALAGKPVRLRFVMRDADLYAFRFVPQNKATSRQGQRKKGA